MIQVLELGIVVHSVIIGISLGASESPKTIKPLVAALTFHQFFEGMGLGGCIVQVYSFKLNIYPNFGIFFFGFFVKRVLKSSLALAIVISKALFVEQSCLCFHVFVLS